MDEQLQRIMLFDFYGELLTRKQREYYHLHYNEDLSLAEIAADEGISRQGVRHLIKKGEEQLDAFEARLGLARRHEELTLLSERVAKEAEALLSSDSSELREAGKRLSLLAREISEK